MQYRLEAYRKRHYDKHRDSLIRLLREHDCKHLAEIGVYKCLTAMRVLEKLGDSLETYYLVDQWKPFGDPKGKGENDAGCPGRAPWNNYLNLARKLEQQWDCVKVLHMDSKEAAQHVPDGSLDLVFIDADHSYKMCKRDIDVWTPKVRLGGIVAGHDYYTRWPGVVRAVDESFPFDELQFLPDTVWYRVKK